MGDPMLTLGQAAKETGFSKTAISRAIKSGRLSASKNEQGDYQIDPAELFRVYPVTGERNSYAKQDATPKDYSVLQGNSDVLCELLRQVEGERDDLRRRLDNAEAAREREADEREKAAAELRRLTLLITHEQQAPKAEPEQAQPVPPATPPKFLGASVKVWATIALASFMAVVWMWWNSR